MSRGGDPHHLLSQARKGDRTAREELIEKFTPFVMNLVCRLCGRFVRLGQDDEASIGLMAFNEAIDSYDPQKGVSFLKLAETIIRRRIIDYFRREERHRQHFAVEDLPGSLEPQESLVAWEEACRREEIYRFLRELAAYGISLSDLVKCCPRHEDARQRALMCARALARDPELKSYLEEKRELPVKALMESLEISRKTLERYRKYIIAVALILIGDYEYLKGYIDRVNP